MSEDIIKKALYHFDVGVIYRPTIEELEHKNYSCPRCKSNLKLIVRKPVVNSLYICPDCDYFIPYKNILHDDETIQSKKEEIKGRSYL